MFFKYLRGYFYLVYMNDDHKVSKPIKRNFLRRFLGREYFILKRRIKWLLGKEQWANKGDKQDDWSPVFKHESLILRPLKSVDMYLQENKRKNLEIAIAHINGLIMYPGETFSLWKKVGRPKRMKGYLDGLVLNQGKIEKGIGGGLCQLGNLLFWIFAHSPLIVTERHRHSFDVFPDVNRKVPFGAGATLSYNYIDLQVKNTTNNAFQIILWMDKTHLHGELVSKEKVRSKFRIEERNHIMSQQIWGGYTRHNQIFKIETQPNGQITEDLLVENHALMMYNPFIEENLK